MLSYVHAYHADTIPYFLILQIDNFPTVYKIVDGI